MTALREAKAKRTRSLRSDSAAAAIDAAVNASKPPPKPPKEFPIRKKDSAVWAAIMNSRARGEWAEIDLIIASQLARCTTDLLEQQQLLDREHALVLDRLTGVLVQNPRSRHIDMLQKRQAGYMRTLRMGGNAAGDPRTLANKRKLERDAREAREQVQDSESKNPDSGLLA